MGTTHHVGTQQYSFNIVLRSGYKFSSPMRKLCDLLQDPRVLRARYKQPNQSMGKWTEVLMAPMLASVCKLCLGLVAGILAQRDITAESATGRLMTEVPGRRKLRSHWACWRWSSTHSQILHGFQGEALLAASS
jgi:hypothetical protein